MSVGPVYLRDKHRSVEATAQWYEQVSFQTTPAFDLGKALGKGMFSKVARVSFQGREWAVKKTASELGTKLIKREAAILNFLNQQEKIANQEYFVQVIALVTFESNPMLVMKLYKGGDLLARVTQTVGGLPLENVLKITEQLLKALSFLKDQGVIHRDIKLANIFIDCDETVKLGDFGFAMEIEDKKAYSILCGTPQSQSPELVAAYRGETLIKEHYPFGSPSDVWATGCAMFQAFSRVALFSGMSSNWMPELQDQQKTLRVRLTGLLGEICREKADQKPGDLSLFNAALTRMLELDPEKRLTPEEGITVLFEEESFVWIGEADLPNQLGSSEESEPFELIQEEEAPFNFPPAQKANNKPKKELVNLVGFITAGISKLLD